MLQDGGVSVSQLLLYLRTPHDIASNCVILRRGTVPGGLAGFLKSFYLRLEKLGLLTWYFFLELQPITVQS